MIRIREYNESDDENVKNIFRNGMNSHIWPCLMENLSWWPCYVSHILFFILCYFKLNIPLIYICFAHFFFTAVHFYLILMEFEKYYSLTSKDLKNIKKYYNGRNGIFWVAENLTNKELAGHVALDASLIDVDNSVELRRCAVASAYRNHGIGKLLVEHLLKTAISDYKASKVFLTTSTIQTSAIKLYHKLGFIKEHKTDKFMLNVKVVRMEKHL